MTDVELNADAIRAIAARLEYPSGAFIGGRFVDSASGETFETVNPATRATITRIASCGDEDVNRSVMAAQAAFDAGHWSGLHPAERKSVLKRLAQLIDRDRVDLAILESVEGGKPVRDCLALDLPETIHCIEWFAEGIDKLYDLASPSGHAAIGLIMREPISVVACVLPWNYPLMTLAWKMAPALAVGATMIVKPAEQTSMTALKIAALASEAGVPDGVFNVLPGFGETAGRAIGLHPDIGAISFTGSTDVGRMFLQYSAASNLKRVVLECGGKSPCVVLEDAGDLEVVARHAALAAFLNSGQNCTANSRLIVPKRLKGQLLEHLIAETSNWLTGDPLDPDHHLGAIVSREQFEKVSGYIEAGVHEGGTIVHRGKVRSTTDGFFIPPTIIDGVDQHSAIAREEIFGPVLAVLEVENDEEAIQVANDTPYGLQASVFSRDITRAHQAAKQLQAGTVTINGYGEGDIATPFGGHKLSGFGGHDKSIYAYDQYSQKKTVWVNLA
jgi:4-(gamma-glutamylamino)butanal dehydrogenase